MARESQGLQVLLIVFVMLSVVLGVSLYLYVKKADEATKLAAAADARERDAKAAMDAMQKERDILKTLIGFPERKTEEIQKQFADDMQTYGNEKNEADKAGADKPLFDPGTLFYSRLLASMNKVIQDRTDELITSRAQLADLETTFKNREAAKDDAIKAITADHAKQTADVQRIVDSFNSGQLATADEQKATVALVATIKDKANKAAGEAAQAQSDATKAIQQKDAELKKMTAMLRIKDTEQMDVPSGEITWVSLPNKMVWINRGRADALQRQTKFTVYSADSTNAAKAVKKGSIEVTRIEGDHMAQARILEDKIADPILVGDKVFTPLWSPGQQNHFALTGIMNLDGDGHNQLSVVRGLIIQNGGAVDCWLDEQGHKQGQITADTRFLVKGDAPEKSSPEMIKNHGAIISDAERYQVHKMTLSDFKQQMNYQKSSSVEHLGSGGSTSDASRAAMATKAGKAAKAAPKSGDGEN
ncbi:MAG: hypothetical protein ACLP9L_20845 [Thermoguttaceae bacterium]